MNIRKYLKPATKGTRFEAVDLEANYFYRCLRCPLQQLNYTPLAVWLYARVFSRIEPASLVEH